MILQRRWVVLVAGLTLLAAHACSSDEGGVAGNGGAGAQGGGTGGSSGSGATAGSGADGGLILDASQGAITQLAIDPPSATIEVQNGTAGPVQFDAVATFEGGGTGRVQATWSFDRIDLAGVSSTGELAAHGTRGGQGTLTASAGGQSATANVVVRLHFADNAAGLPQSDIDKFANPTGTSSGTLLYPYDQTMFARGILPPELMWSGAGPSDAYKISIVDANVDLTAYVTAADQRWLLPRDWWEALTQSNDGTSAAAVSVQRLDDTGVAHPAMTQTWKIAPGSLRGTIYYWAVNMGQIMKINPGADAPVPAFDPGPFDQLGTPAPVSGYNGESPPWDNQGTGKRCVACHTVSRDGSTLAATFSACGTSGGGCDRPWGVVDTASEQVTLMSGYSPGPAIYSALTPNGSHLVHDTVGFRMVLADPTTAQTIPSALDAYTQVAHPQFSADGRMMAFASNTSGAYPVEFQSSDLDVVDVDLTQAPYFTNRRTVQAGGGEEIAFPGFSPDGKWIVYQRGSYSRASFGDPAAGPLQTGFNDLFMVDLAGSIGQVKLDRANGASVLGAKDARRNYQPRVNPVAVGGYFWVVFVSPRDYGNRMQSATDSTNQNRKQLWVAAIDANPTAGSDPSHPAFWLPGQDLSTINMDGYWALEPCKDDGTAGCNEGYECCSGFCRDQGDGTLACVPPPTNECARIGEACSTAGDCCDSTGVDCIGGFCSLIGPQ